MAIWEIKASSDKSLVNLHTDKHIKPSTVEFAYKRDIF